MNFQAADEAGLCCQCLCGTHGCKEQLQGSAWLGTAWRLLPEMEAALQLNLVSLRGSFGELASVWWERVPLRRLRYRLVRYRAHVQLLAVQVPARSWSNQSLVSSARLHAWSWSSSPGSSARLVCSWWGQTALLVHREYLLKIGAPA